jgi:hypothetical protein
MPTCANCNKEALYTYQVTELFGINYCQDHLPRFLYSQRSTGALDVKVPEVPAAPAKKAKSAPVNTPAESTPVEETPPTV